MTGVLLGVVFLVHVCSGKCMLSRVELLHLLYTNCIPEFHAEFSCKLLICQVGYLHQITSFYLSSLKCMARFQFRSKLVDSTQGLFWNVFLQATDLLGRVRAPNYQFFFLFPNNNLTRLSLFKAKGMLHAASYSDNFFPISLFVCSNF